MKKRRAQASNHHDDDSLRQRIGTRIRNLRRDRDIQQGQLAKDAGIDPATLNQIENGKRLPDVRTVLSLATQLGVAPSLILDPTATPTGASIRPRNAETEPQGTAPPLDFQAAIQTASYQVLSDLFAALGEALESRHPENVGRQAARTRTGTADRAGRS